MILGVTVKKLSRTTFEGQERQAVTDVFFPSINGEVFVVNYSLVRDERNDASTIPNNERRLFTVLFPERIT